MRGVRARGGVLHYSKKIDVFLYMTFKKNSLLLSTSAGKGIDTFWKSTNLVCLTFSPPGKLKLAKILGVYIINRPGVAGAVLQNTFVIN